MDAKSLLGSEDLDLTSTVPAHRERLQSASEEIANSLSHGIGFLAAIAATPFLLHRAAAAHVMRILIGACVFTSTILFLYLVSTLYHALPQGRAKHIFRIIEHSAIFLLIAGTYTPFTLGVLHGPLGWTLFGTVWGLAAAGLLLKLLGGVRYPVLSTLLYLGMGWTLVFAIRPLWLRMPHAGFFWIVGGGLAYTAGVAFFAADRIRYFHFIWHLFVLAGTILHFLAVLWYAA